MNTNNTTNNNSTHATARNNRNRRIPEMKKDIITTIPNKTVNNFSESNIISDVTSITALKKLIEVSTERLEKINGKLIIGEAVTRLQNADFSIYERVMIFLAHQHRVNNESLSIIQDMYDTIRLYATVRINLELNKAKTSYDVDTYVSIFGDAFLDVTTEYNFEILKKIFNETVAKLSSNTRHCIENDYDVDFTNPFTIYMFSDCNNPHLYREKFEEFWNRLHECYTDAIIDF